MRALCPSELSHSSTSIIPSQRAENIGSVPLNNRLIRPMLLPLQLATAFPASEWRERMERSLTEVGLWHDVSSRLREPASILSGGQQQRLCLARTLALEPEILLLDEPTASLDPATTHTIENLLLKLAERYPILLVSHGLPQAKRMASRIVLFGKGRLQGMLSPEELPNEAEMNRFFDGGDAGNR